MTLEEKIAKLNEMADRLEGDIGLEESLKIFEQSVTLAKENW